MSHEKKAGSFPGGAPRAEVGLQEGELLFFEKQRFASNRLLCGAVVVIFLVTLGISLPALADWLTGRLDGSRPPSLAGPLITAGFIVALDGCLIALLFIGYLVTEIRSDAVYVQFHPFTRRHRIEWAKIEAAEVRTYRPIADYGGWGLRRNASGKAYNVAGNVGLQLVHNGGKRWLIGTQQGEELAKAVKAKCRAHDIRLSTAPGLGA